MFTIKLFYFESVVPGYKRISNVLINTSIEKINDLRYILLQDNPKSIINVYGNLLSPSKIIGYYLVLDQDSPYLIFNVKLKFKETNYHCIQLQGNSNSRAFFNELIKLLKRPPTNKFIQFQQLPNFFCMFRHYKEIEGVKYDFSGTDLSKAGDINILDIRDEDEIDNGSIDN